MTFSSTRRFCSGALVVAALICLSNCAVPLAPGYRIEKQSITVRFVPGAPPHLAIRAQYRLANVGNAPLHFIGVELPGDKSFGRANLHAEINSKEITLQHNPAEAADDWRVPMPVAWRQKEKLNLALSYDLAAQSATDPRVFVAANTFSLNDSGWFPALMGFKAILSPGIVRPNPTDLSVIVPADFRVTASGQLHGTRKQNGEVEYRFRIGASDFDPYVLAGQYNEQRVSTGGVTVAIWTVKPIGADQAQDIASAVTAARNSYVQNFGGLPKSMNVIYDVDVPDEVISADNPAFLVPGAVYVSQIRSERPSTAGIFSNLFVPVELAHTWFAHVIVPRPEAWTLAEGLDIYASMVTTPGEDEMRNRRITSVLSYYDADKLKAVEKPILSLALTDPEPQLAFAGDKIQLFFFALEDKCGRENVEHAIAHMVYALRGQQYGYNDFRAALEQECHQDLSSMFATWLDQKGIPVDFRARYENATSK